MKAVQLFLPQVSPAQIEHASGSMRHWSRSVRRDPGSPTAIELAAQLVGQLFVKGLQARTTHHLPESVPNLGERVGARRVLVAALLVGARIGRIIVSRILALRFYRLLELGPFLALALRPPLFFLQPVRVPSPSSNFVDGYANTRVVLQISFMAQVMSDSHMLGTCKQEALRLGPSWVIASRWV